MTRGSEVDIGGGAKLAVIFPDRDVAGVSPHGGVLVLGLTFGETSVLFTGDMEDPVENYLTRLDGQIPSGSLKSDVLKVGHHGSRTSTGERFLGYVSPKHAVISSGTDNSYGHPHQATLDTLERFEVETLRTDWQGTIVMRSDGQEINFSTDRK